MGETTLLVAWSGYPLQLLAHFPLSLQLRCGVFTIIPFAKVILPNAISSKKNIKFAQTKITNFMTNTEQIKGIVERLGALRRYL